MDFSIWKGQKLLEFYEQAAARPILIEKRCHIMYLNDHFMSERCVEGDKNYWCFMSDILETQIFRETVIKLY